MWREENWNGSGVGEPFQKKQSAEGIMAPRSEPEILKPKALNLETQNPSCPFVDFYPETSTLNPKPETINTQSGVISRPGVWLQLFYSSTQRLCLSSKPSIIHPLWLHVS